MKQSHYITLTVSASLATLGLAFSLPAQESAPPADPAKQSSPEESQEEFLDLQVFPGGVEEVEGSHYHFQNRPRLPKHVASGDIIISWSEKRDTAWGFSKKTGQWTAQALDHPALTSPTVGNSVAAWQSGDKIYAYSGEAGRWDVLEMPAERNVKPTVHDDMVVVTPDDHMYIFAAATGQWSSPTDPDVPTAPQQQAPITYLGSEDAGGGDAFPDVDVEKLRLGGSDLRIGGGPDGSPGMDFQGHPMAPPVDAYQSANQESLRLARRWRELQTKYGERHPEMVKLKRELRAAVAQAFDARQKFHQAEIEAIRQQLRSIEQKLSGRKRLKEKVIDRRVEELLDPALSWEPATTQRDQGGLVAYPSSEVSKTKATDKPEPVLTASESDLTANHRLVVLAENDSVRQRIHSEATDILSELQKDWWDDLAASPPYHRIVIQASIDDDEARGASTYRPSAGGQLRDIRIELTGNIEGIIDDQLPRQLSQVLLAERIGAPPQWATMGVGLLAESHQSRTRNWRAFSKFRNSGTLMPMIELLNYSKYPADPETREVMYVQSMALAEFISETFSPDVLLAFAADANRLGAAEAVTKYFGFKTVGDFDVAFRHWAAER